MKSFASLVMMASIAFAPFPDGKPTNYSDLKLPAFKPERPTTGPQRKVKRKK